MKRETAFKYCQRIYQKLAAIDGRLLTPGFNNEYVDFVSIYAVGSFVKGKTEPNDLDLLIEVKGGGNRLTLGNGGLLDTRYQRIYGMSIVKSAETEAFRWLTRGMKNIDRINAYIEETVFDVKVEIYPHFRLDTTAVSTFVDCESDADAV